MQLSDTEKKILDAAISIFQEKGMAGARMQEIADAAQINKAMLHYYFRNKQQLFEAVFLQAFQKFAPQINQILNADTTVFEKIEAFVDQYIGFALKNPYLPAFLVQEINTNPKFIEKFLSHTQFPDLTRIRAQVSEGVAQGLLRPITPKQLLLNVISLTAFPFVANGLVRHFLQMDAAEFEQMMEARRTMIPELIIDSITA